MKWKILATPLRNGSNFARRDKAVNNEDRHITVAAERNRRAIVRERRQREAARAAEGDGSGDQRDDTRPDAARELY